LSTFQDDDGDDNRDCNDDEENYDQINSDEAPMDTCIEEFFAFTKVFHARK